MPLVLWNSTDTTKRNATVRANLDSYRKALNFDEALTLMDEIKSTEELVSELAAPQSRIGAEMKNRRIDIGFSTLLVVMILCGACGNHAPASFTDKKPSAAEQAENEKQDAIIDAGRMLSARLSREKLEEQRGQHEYFVKKMDEIGRQMRTAGIEPTSRKKDTSPAAVASEAKNASATPAEHGTSVDSEAMVYGLIPKLRREISLSEVFLRRYETTGQEPDSSIPEAKELCQPFVQDGKDAYELNQHEQLTFTSKTYSDAIEQLHPVLVEANSKMKQVLAIGLSCRGDWQ